ncbi:MAG: D-aminoacyl-tRNA deacylase [Pygmaiobacter massiliensis]|nr:D-aminoacyl-tRNA deacylase [Pygmaiobacter massiliensis]
MKAVLQRVKHASVTIEGDEERSIGQGLCILLGVAEQDTEQDACQLARKCAELRIFEDEAGKLNKSALELGLAALVVSNFTLQADTKKGRRPSFIRAAKQPLSQQLYQLFVQELAKAGIAPVKTGEFGAEMQVLLQNDGPVTLVLDTEEWKRAGGKE